MEGPCLIHGDLWSGNLLHGADGPVLVDPSAQAAERGLELGMMRWLGGFPASFWEAYEAAAPFRRRCTRPYPHTSWCSFWCTS